MENDLAILVCCCIIIVLLIILLLKAFTGKSQSREIFELEKQMTAMRESLSGDNRQIIYQLTALGESNTKSISSLTQWLQGYLDRQQTKTNASIDKLHSEMEAYRRETDRQLREINGIVTEKMQTILDRKLNEAFDTVVKNMSELGKGLSDAQSRQQKASSEQLEALRQEFDRIRTDMLAQMEKIRTENTAVLDRLRTDNQASLDKINQTVNEKLQKTLNDRITQSFELVNKRLSEVYEGLGEMKKVASGVSDLKNVLSNVKNRGIMGEIQLSAILADILAPEQYETQFRINPATAEMVDFAVRLPGANDGEYVYLPIDSKFPGDSYANLIAAYDSGDPAELKQKRITLEQEIKRCARSIQSKYIIPPHSTDFAIMFLPFEGLYAEVVNMGLVEVLQRDYRVNITGPSTMAAMLNSLQMGFRTLAIQKKSGEVWKILEAAKKEFDTFETVLTKTRDRLRQADEELDKLIGTRTRAINRKLRSVSALEAPDSDNDDI